jgi:hypothetical protein
MRCLATRIGSSCSSNRFVFFTSPIDPLVCTPKPFPSWALLCHHVCVRRYTGIFASPLPTTHPRPLLRPPVDLPTRINDYYHLIYVLYAYRRLSRPFRCLISASGQLSAALRRPYPRSNRARVTEYVWRIVANGHGSTSIPFSQSLDFLLITSPDLSMRFGCSCLPILVSSVAWLVRAR